jgi:citrate lyase subunit beta/citryl-CoA lyase
MLAKAPGLGADVVLLDLEDAVAAEEKTDVTRARVAVALREQEWGAATRAVRVNAVPTRWCFRDVVAVVEGAGATLDSVVVPKVESAAHVHFVDLLLAQLEDELGLGKRIALELQIESPRGLVAIEDIAVASSRTETLIFGPGDFAAALGVPQLTVGAIDRDYPGDPWHYVLMRIVTTAHALGLQAIDGPYAVVRDVEGLRESAGRSQRLGFDGKWAIHPEQVATCNEVYTPSPQQVERAGRILDAYAAAPRPDRAGAVLFEGEMIDQASRKMAEQVVARARAAGMATR